MTRCSVSLIATAHGLWWCGCVVGAELGFRAKSWLLWRCSSGEGCYCYWRAEAVLYSLKVCRRVWQCYQCCIKILHEDNYFGSSFGFYHVPRTLMWVHESFKRKNISKDVQNWILPYLPETVLLFRSQSWGLNTYPLGFSWSRASVTINDNLLVGQFHRPLDLLHFVQSYRWGCLVNLEAQLTFQGPKVSL